MDELTIWTVESFREYIYIADYIEPGRKQAPNLKEVRKLAFQNLNLALLKILDDTLSYLQDIGNDVDPMTQKTYDYYAELIKKETTMEA